MGEIINLVLPSYNRNTRNYFLYFLKLKVSYMYFNSIDTLLNGFEFLYFIFDGDIFISSLFKKICLFFY